MLAFVIGVLGSLLQPPPPPADSIQLAGTSVAVIWPPPQMTVKSSFLESGGWNYLLDRPLPNRFLRFKTDGGWDDLHRQADEVRAKQIQPVATWRIKATIFTRAELLDHNVIYRSRRSTLESPQITSCLEALALFKAMAEARSEGKLKINIDANIDPDPIRQIVDGPGPVLGQSWIDATFGPRVNSTEFDADDKVYRGPYNSIFFIHPALTPSGTTSTVNGMPISGIGYYTDGRADKPGGLAMSLFNAWVGHLAFGARRQGYSLPVPASEQSLSDPLSILTGSMWSTASQLKEPLDSDYVIRRYRPSSEVSLAWADVRDDPFAMLPKLTGVSVGSSSGNVRLFNELELPSGSAVAADLLLAESIAEKLGAAAKVKGYFEENGRLYILFSAPAHATLFQPTIAKPLLVSGSGLPVNPVGEGFFTVKKIADQDRGEALEVTEVGAYRRGRAVLLAGNDGEPIIDTSKTPFLEFWVKTSGLESFALELESPTGAIQFVTLGPSMEPAELGQKEAQSVAIAPGGAWQKLIVDVAKAMSGERMISRISLVPPPTAKYFERSVFEPVTIQLGGFQALATSPGVSPPANSPTLSTGEAQAQRLLGLDLSDEVSKAAFLEGLRDKAEIAKLNGAAVLRSKKLPEALPALIDLSRSATPFIAEIASQALAFQDTPEAWSALIDNVQKGPFDHNRQSAAKQLATKADPTTAFAISTMMTARSWRARQQAADAIAKLPGDKAPLVLIALLQETDPCVRFSVVSQANPELELVNQRLLYYGVNDPSENVRAASLVRLLDSPFPEFRNNALKGIRDDSKAIRLALLAAITKKPKREFRQTLRLAIADRRAEVRAAALEAFAVFPEKIDLAEVDNTLNDPDPRVQNALIDFALAKGIKLSDASLSGLRSSVDKEVAARAAALGK